MFRLRLAILAAGAAFVLRCGCLNLADHSWFGRRTCTGPVCCEGGVIGDHDGPIVEDAATLPPIPVGPGACAPGPLVPQNSVPQLNSPPRLVPQPQAPIMPYTPQ